MIRFKSVCKGLVLALLILALTAVPAFAGDGDTVEISTAGELLELLSTSYGEAYDNTYGKTFVLTDDITIDTSGLPTSYANLQGAGHERVFMGVLDGNSHTVTVVSDDGSPAKPLFDSLRGSGKDKYAEVKNLKLIFKDDVAGTTIAAHTSYARITNVDISFEKDIIFASNAAGYTFATGVYGFTADGIDVRVTDVSVTATGGAPYGIIGSRDAQNSSYVMAAGVYTEHNAAGGTIVCDGITVDVRGIYAVSGFTPSNATYGSVCAAGAVSGMEQTNLRIANANINVAEDISASTADGSPADADACGLAFSTLAMYSCNVRVGGDISASASPDGYNSSYSEWSDVCAAGMGYEISTKYNESLFGAKDTGSCSVTVGGDIIAVTSGGVVNSSYYSSNTRACGIAVYTGPQYTWRDVSVEAANIRAIANDTRNAYALGFAYQTVHTSNNSGDAFDNENCSVSVGEISAVSEQGGGYAAGYMYWGYVACRNCTVTAQSINSTGLDADASGFAYSFSPNTSLWRSEAHGELDSCNVTVGSIHARNTDAQYGAMASGFVGMNRYAVDNITAAIRNCEVIISDELLSESADGIPFEALFAGVNTDSYSLYDNTVTLPKSQADVQTIGDADYVLFTASEVDGQADKTDWQSRNRVIFAGDSVNSVTCAFDDGNTTYGTLWELERTAQLCTVDYDLAGGTGAPGADYSSVTVNQGEKIILPAAPGREDYEFIGWSDGTNVYQPGNEVEITASVTFTAQWEADILYFTLTYNSNGGTEYPDESHPEGKEVTLDKQPERQGYSFAGWFADEELTQRIETVTMTDHTTVHAGWEKDIGPWIPPVDPPEEPDDAEYSPNWLNTTEHFAYIIGYEDGTVRPDAGITRAEVATIFFRLLTDEARESFWSDTNDYSDVADGSWYNIAVSTLSNMGILGGYENGTFRPNAPITRAEFAKIAVSFFDHEAIEAVNGFVDVARGAWYENYVAVAAEIGLIEGYGGNVFRPEAAITRAEACAIINRTLGRAPDAEHLLPVSQMNTWPDNADTGVWYYAHIQEATNSHEYSWSGDIEQWTEKLPEPDWDALQR